MVCCGCGIFWEYGFDLKVQEVSKQVVLFDLQMCLRWYVYLLVEWYDGDCVVDEDMFCGVMVFVNIYFI